MKLMRMRPSGIVLVAVFTQAFGQPAARPEFDVVSIKPSRFSGGAIAVGGQSTPGTISLAGIRLKDLIARAYSLKAYQVVGPNRLDDEYYNVVAKSAQPVPDSEQRLMLQSMLESRFKLAAHMDTRELPCYELVIAKGGPKVHPVAADKGGPRAYPNAPGVRATSISIGRLADILSTKVDRPVQDKTGLAGVYDIDLEWARDSDAGAGPSVFTAVQEQLGLRLEPGRAPVEVLVVDGIDRPSEN